MLSDNANRQDTLRPMRTRTLSRRCVSVTWAVLLILACGAARGADYALPGTGFTRQHALEWEPKSAPAVSLLADPTSPRTLYYEFERTPLFGPTAWSGRERVYYEDVCTTREVGGSRITKCKKPAPTDGVSRYRHRAGNDAGDSAWNESEQDIILGCRVGQFDLMLYAGLARPPVDCR